jgi:poly(3-hydroxybutyrate) depolymerase
MGKDYPKPQFDVGMREEIVMDKPFCALRRFVGPDNNAHKPKVLLFAPMSGHYATLLRDTVKSLSQSHDVYISDWKNACDVPLSEGEFGLEDYISYAQDFMRELGPDTHVIAVCQPTVAVLAATADLAAQNDKAQPKSLTLMAGPIFPPANHTDVSRFGIDKDLSWFRQTQLATVPPWYAGAGRVVRPGFLQVGGFAMMNAERHAQAHREYFEAVRTGDTRAAEKIAEFYDEYFAICDMDSKMYMDTIEHVFQKYSLAAGNLTYKGRKVDLSAIKHTALMTVEGDKDDIVGPGQTRITHDLCKNIPEAKRAHYVQPNAGHFGVFSGSRWREEIYPRVAAFIEAQGGPAPQKKRAPGSNLG